MGGRGSGGEEREGGVGRRREEEEWGGGVGRRREKEGGKDIKQETHNYFYTQNGFSRPFEVAVFHSRKPIPQTTQSFRRPKDGQVNW